MGKVALPRILIGFAEGRSLRCETVNAALLKVQQPWAGPEGCRKLRLPDYFKTIGT